jgi:16S rRNA processing protein RimM
VHSSVPERFVEGMRLFALAENNTRRELILQGFWPHKGALVMKFEGVDSISDAETLIGSELQVPAEERGRLEQGWAYVSDLIGCTLFDGEREVGTIKDVRFGAGEAPLLVVEGEREYEIPFAEAYVRSVELERNRIVLELPEGMLEINAPLSEEEKQQQRGR